LVIELLVHHEAEAFSLHDLVLIPLFIQGKREPWASAAVGEVNADGLLVFTREIFVQLLHSGWCYFYHDSLLRQG
jgi:hypothetical protein